MENIIEILAFLIFIAFTGMSAASKKAREKQKDSQTTPPIFTSSESPNQSMDERTNWRSYQNPSESRTTPLQRSRPESEPFPTTPPQEPIWSKMLREMLDMNDATPTPVFEPDTQEKRTKKLTRKTREAKPQPVMETRPPAPPRKPTPRPRAEQSPLPSPLAKIYARAQAEPLQAAILLSEIIQAPRSKRRQIRTLS